MTAEIVPDLVRHFRRFWPSYRLSQKHIRVRLTAEFLRQLATPGQWRADEVTPFERARVLDPEPDHALLADALASARSLFPQLAGVEIAESWAGMIDVTPDALPVLCAADRPEGYFIATGFSGHGFGMGPGAGLLMSELIRDGQARVDLTPFRLGRFFDGPAPEPYGRV